MDIDIEEERRCEVISVACANATHSVTLLVNQLLFQLPREPYVCYVSERKAYMDSVIFNDDKCRSNLRMGTESFRRLCILIRESNLLVDTRNCEVEEVIMRFLHILGHNVRHRVIGARFYQSLETISRQFNQALDVVLKLYKCLVADHGEGIHSGGTPPQISNDARYAQYFKDCLGALDGTHIVATVPEEEVERFRSGRKDFTSQNVLAACSFDLKFTYILVGWEGTAHDQRVFDDARTRPNPFIIPSGKYYLADAGYGLEPGILTPYRNTRYHLSEHRDRVPQNHKELYNKRHSALRNVIERAFGVLKKRWPMLSTYSFYSYKSQVKITMACFILHNHIMGVDPNDPLVVEANTEIDGCEEVEVGSSTGSNDTQNTFRASQIRSQQFRENMARKMFDDYRHRRFMFNGF